MNNKVYEELDSLYAGFMGLTADRQKAVVKAAQNLLEAQRAIESLLKKTGAKAPSARRDQGEGLAMRLWK
jgi:hypothetical protein